ncbi:hypothetical protein [Prevotella sp.]
MESITPEQRNHLIDLYRLALVDEDFDMREVFLLTELCKKYNVNLNEISIKLTSTEHEVLIPESVEERIKYLYELTQMAWADNIIQDCERDMLRNYALRYDFLEENVDSIVDYLIDSVRDGKTLESIYKELQTED